MAITVGELADIPHLGLEVLAGEAGVQRTISWTHTSDLPEPWRWITGGELLMTNGLSFPKAATDQELFAEKLNDMGVSGLAIGEKMYCPPLTRRFLQTSDRLGLPVLWIRYPLPFVAISRAVAEATLLDQSTRLTRTVRIYDLVRRHIAAGTPSSQLFESLARELGCRLYVCDRETGEPWFPGSAPLDPVTENAVAELSATSTNVSAGAFGLPAADGRTALLTDIQRHPGAALVVITASNTRVDPIQLQHAATVVSLELSETLLVLEHTRRDGATLLDRLLENRADPEAAARLLSDTGLRTSDVVTVTARGGDEKRALTVHNALWRNSIPYLITLREDLLYALLPDNGRWEGVLTRSLGSSARIGVSQRLNSLTRFQDTVHEATWALSLASRRETVLSYYGRESHWIGLSDVEDARALVDRVLQPLRNYDAEHKSDLVTTLDAFLKNRRSWQTTAKALHVHRQTVLYRIRRVAELTGLDPADTDALVELWTALRAAELIDAR
jgi:PucR family transcriptional regulator, purine catabolism regulatory protein